MPLFGRKPSKKPTRIYFATDLHGSERTFRKFINAGKFYGADVLIMGGDILGKLAVPIIREGNGTYRASLQGRTERLSGEADSQRPQERLGLLGFYFRVMDEDEFNAHLAYFLASLPVILGYNLVTQPFTWTSLTLGVTFGCGYVFVVTSLAAALLPYRAREVYEASPGAHYKVGDIPLITILGGLGAVAGTLMVATFLFSKELGVLGNWDFSDFPNHLWAQIIALVIIVVSAAWYFGAKSGQKSRGINVEYAFKEIPPE